jgi:hypothetical protein
MLAAAMRLVDGAALTQSGCSDIGFTDCVKSGLLLRDAQNANLLVRREFLKLFDRCANVRYLAIAELGIEGRDLPSRAGLKNGRPD